MQATKPGLLDEVGDYVDRHGLLVGVKLLLVACSGGGDSVVLLDVLGKLAPRFGVQLAVAHLDHASRGEESDRDARFVRQLATRLDLPFAIGRAAAPPASGSLEAHFRAQRLEFLASAANDLGADAVALGHTLDDQAETVLMNLARGTGRLGMGGIRTRVRIGKLLLVRPLLGTQRAKLRSYAKQEGLTWLEDASNADARFMRNRFRGRVLPELEEAVPGAAENIARAADLFREEEAWLEGVTDDTLAAVSRVTECGRGVELDLEAIRALPRPLARRLLRAAVRGVKGDLKGIYRDHIDAVNEAVVGGSERARDLPGVRVSREEDTVRLLPLIKRRVVVSRDAVPGRDKS